MYALIDGNCFFVSCERAFRPDLKNVPVVVLSSNDGCVVSRSPEAKQLGIKMSEPYFQIKHLVQSGELVVFSSNFTLYSDLSRRMMETIASTVPSISVYSIDECFASLDGMSNLYETGILIKEKVLRWVGIPTCIGIAPTRTLAKFCNRMAKEYPTLNGVVVWNDWSEDIQRRALKSQSVGEIWGIGRQLLKHLNAQGIFTALDFYEYDAATLRRLYGVTVERTYREMHGTPCSTMADTPERPQQILRSRSFGHLITDLESLEAAVSHHTKVAVRKLWEEQCTATTVSVFVYTNRFRKQDEQYHAKQSTKLASSTNDWLSINKAAQSLLHLIFRPGLNYKKCGVELSGINPVGTGLQQDFWEEDTTHKKLMQTIGDIQHRFGRDSINLGCELLSNNWGDNHELQSDLSLTQVKNLPVID